MTITEAIKHRRSVRTFESSPSEDVARKILEFAQKVENPYDIPITWKLLSAKKDGLSSPVIGGTDCWIAGKMRRCPHAEEAFGYTFEKVVLFAETLGIGTTWIAGTMDRKAFERAMSLGEGEVMPCVSPLGVPAKKMSLKETMMRKGIKADQRLEMGELIFSCSPEAVGKYQLQLEMVRLSPSAVNKQPWRMAVQENKVHFYEKQSKGYVTADGWDLQKIDMGIALCHFETAAQEEGLRPVFSIEDPGISAGELIYVATYTV